MNDKYRLPIFPEIWGNVAFLGDTLYDALAAQRVGTGSEQLKHMALARSWDS